ncbi:hypothetical protein DL764_010328 [Monosporascus ibericus]|uniref:Isopropylmalate dehydrogenase-like domain-containing protein n=1 Tax=Monosporascus ibericus TaxID=155417 RepID=A0A4Q4SSY3_9PEZI|nr:hypothetical protein DL764_010328 [Monosporascus ibericus]
MASHNIVVFAGDHCGPEARCSLSMAGPGSPGTAFAMGSGHSNKHKLVQVLKAIEANSPSAGKFNLQEHLLGGCSINAHGTPLTEEALAAAKAADAVLLGAIGGPEWARGRRPRRLLAAQGRRMPRHRLHHPARADGRHLLRRPDHDGREGFAQDTEPYSRPEIERVARLAARLALARNPPAPVWSLDKANVLATSRLWRRVMTETFAREFPDLKLQHQLIDSAALIMVKNPSQLNGVIVTSNLFGDIISDEASAIPRASAMASTSLFTTELTGSAPDISGKGIVNPIGTILSVAMMCRYSLRLPREADAIEAAVKNAIDGGLRTKDLGGSAGTKEVGDAVVAELVKELKG